MEHAARAVAHLQALAALKPDPAQLARREPEHAVSLQVAGVARVGALIGVETYR